MDDIKSEIYVVSETAALALSIQKGLSSPDFFIQIFSDPMQAIKRTIQDPPCAVISDFQFNGIMGLEVLQQIKIKYPDMKTVLLVNSETHPDVKTAKELGISILSKPVDVRKLDEILRDVRPVTAPEAGSGRNVMIVEKSSNIRFKIKKCFANLKTEITEVSNPFELVEKFYIKKWDVIFFDVDNDFMPEDEFLKIVAERKWIPSSFILLSSSWENQKMNRFMAKNFAHFLTIPLQDDELQNLINILMIHG
jgi:DNA-binding NtrC family response regulator